MKKLGVNGIIIPVLVIIEILIFIFNTLCLETEISDYTTGIFTEIIGMLITIIFVEKLLNSSEEKESIKEEKDKIIRMNNVLQMLIERYKILFYSVATPMEKRNYEEAIQMPEEFKMSDMKDLFDNPLDIRYGITESSVVNFLQIEEKIRDYIIETLRTIDFKYNRKLQELLMNFVKISIYYDSRKAIFEANKTSAGEKYITDWVSEGLKEQGDKFYEEVTGGSCKNANLLHPYYNLYIMMNNERNIINKYNDIINEMIKDN